MFSKQNKSSEGLVSPVFTQEVQYTEFPAFAVAVVGSPELNEDGKGYLPIALGKELYKNSIIILEKGESLTIKQKNGEFLVIESGVFVLREKSPSNT